MTCWMWVDAMTPDRNECGRCGQLADRDHDVRMALVNTSRESREDGGPVYASLYEHGYRCVDRDACRSRANKEEAR